MAPTGTTPRPVPYEDDPDTGGFFAAARRGELAVCTCAACGRTLHVPRGHCRHCGSFDVTWRSIAPTGRLHSWTVVEHQVHPAHPVPYTLVLVEPDEAPAARLVGSLPGRVDLHAGQAMEAWFEEIAGGAVLPQWRPAPPDHTEERT